MRQFVHGYNLNEFPRALEELDLLVTFNGTQFDLPVLKSYFPELHTAAGARGSAFPAGPPGLQGRPQKDRAPLRHPPSRRK